MNIDNFWSYFTLVIEIQLNGVALNEFSPIKVYKIVTPVKKAFLITPNIFISYYSFSLNTYKSIKN